VSNILSIDGAETPTDRLRLRLFDGAVLEGRAVHADELRVQKRRMALLVRLIRAPQRRLSRNALIADLWSDSAPEAGRRLLNEAVYVLRRALGPAVLTSVGDALVLDPGIGCDVDDFLEKMSQGRYGDAVDAYAGPFLGGWFVRAAPDFSRWAEDERVGLGRRFREALDAYSAQVEATRDWSLAADLRVRLLREDPLSERYAAGAAHALAKAGELVEALRVIATHRAQLHEELDVAPSAELLALEADIRRGDIDTTLQRERSPVRSVNESTALGANPMLRAPSSRPEQLAAPRQWPGRFLALGLAACALVGVAWYGWSAFAARSLGTDQRRLLIAPYQFLGPVDQQYLAAGMVDEIAGRLAHVGQLQLMTSGVSRRFDSAQSPLAIAKSSGADLLLRGTVTVRPTGNTFRLAAVHSLVRVSNGEILWTWSHDGSTNDAFELPSAVADSVGSRLGIVLSLDAGPDAGTPSPAALDFYHRANGQQSRGREGYGAARELYGNAIRLDSNFARALAGFAQTTARMDFFLIEKDSMQVALAARLLERATALGSQSAEVHLARATWNQMIRRNSRWALAELDTALSLRSDLATTWTERANLRRRENDWPGAARDYERALSIEPRAYATRLEFGNTLMLMHRYDEATTQLEIARELDPSAVDPAAWLAVSAFRGRGDTLEVMRILSRALRTVDARRLRTRVALSFPEVLRAGTGTLFSTLGAPTLADALGDTAAFLALIANRVEEPSAVRQAAADSARHVLERRIAREPESFRAPRRLAKLWVIRGDSSRAFFYARMAVGNAQRARDAMSMAEARLFIAEIEVQTGRLDSARVHVRELLATPSALSAAVLRVDPLWKPLRGGTPYSTVRP
jgi:DNA-binding SARP family transcriptional activator/TolB-like protein